uniref:Uncharacterized protein n=1 Tax=Peronospora matthiolae TaxID=2874970 RepID=A0AAV1TM94_9STRA
MAPVLPVLMHVDNQAATKQLEGESPSIKAKYINVRLKFVCDYTRRGIIFEEYVRSEELIADFLTKALDPLKLAIFRGLMCLSYYSKDHAIDKVAR